MRTLTLAAALLALAAPAHAQIVVTGDGSAQGCYTSAKTGNTGTPAAIRECSDALGEVLTTSDRAATLVNRGVLYMRRGDQERAVSDYERALELQPDLPEAHINASAAFYYLGRDDRALEAIDTALALGTDKEAEALFNRALIHDRQENYRAAYRDLTRVLTLRPDWQAAQDARARYTVQRRS